MTETDAPPQIDPVTKVARNLSAIEDMTAQLLTQAVHKANDREMPGGHAMVALASVASPEAWEHIFEAAEANGRDTDYADDQDDWEPPLQTLLFWSEAWRSEHGYELDRRPTIASEANFIRWCLNWAYDNEPRFDDFARDIHRVRLRLEDVLYAGRRAERSRVVCNRCDSQPRLIRTYGETARFDGYKCPACKHNFDAAEFGDAHAAQLRSQGAARYVPWRDALATLRTQGRPERTVRQWLINGDVDGWCDLSTRALWVWWPDLWRLHLSTQTRQRKSA